MPSNILDTGQNLTVSIKIKFYDTIFQSQCIILTVRKIQIGFKNPALLVAFLMYLACVFHTDTERKIKRGKRESKSVCVSWQWRGGWSSERFIKTRWSMGIFKYFNSTNVIHPFARFCFYHGGITLPPPPSPASGVRRSFRLEPKKNSSAGAP